MRGRKRGGSQEGRSFLLATQTEIFKGRKLKTEGNFESGKIGIRPRGRKPGFCRRETGLKRAFPQSIWRARLGWKADYLPLIKEGWGQAKEWRS